MNNSKQTSLRDVPQRNQIFPVAADRNSCLGSLLWICLALLISFSSGCHKNDASAVLANDAKATLKFWQTVQEPMPGNTLFHRVDSINLETASSQDRQTVVLLLQQMSGACREKASQITSADLTGVDVAAADFGVKKAGFLVESAKFSDSVAKLVDRQDRLTSGQDLLLGFMFALARHSDEGDDAWINAGKEELSAKAKSFGNLPVESEGAAASAKSLSDAAAQLQLDEMQTRIALGKRFGQEFPTAQSLAGKRHAPETIILDDAKLKAIQPELIKSLIGRKIVTTSNGNWSFDAIEEFQTFNAKHGTNYGDVVDIEVATHVRGLLRGAEHNFRLLLTYQTSKDGSVRLMFANPY